MQKKTLINSNFEEFSDDLDQEKFIRNTVNFLRDLNIMSENDLNGIVLGSYASSKGVKHVEAFIDQKKHTVLVQLYLGRLSFLFYNRNKILKQLRENVAFYLGNYTLEAEIRLFKYGKKEE